MSICEDLAVFVSSIGARPLPAEVVAFTGECVLDAVGNLIAGTVSDKAKKVRNGDCFAAYTGTGGGSRIAGGAFASPEAAAFANAVMLRALDLDDGHRYAMGHPGSVIIPAALAVGEALRLSGRETVAAIAAAYEVYARTGTAINPRAYSSLGFESTGLCGAIAAAALAARAKHFDAEMTKNALGIAALFAGGLIEYQNDGTSGKVLCPGWAAANGLRAAALAESGFSGPEHVFEGKQGFFHAHGTEMTEPERLLSGLGENFGILDTYFKIHSCMRGLHASIDGALRLRREHRIAPSDVARIDVKTTSFVKRLDKPHPRAMNETQSNVGFVLCVALVYGEVSQRSLQAGLTDPAVIALEENLAVTVDEKISLYWEQNPSHWVASRIEILLNGGERVEAWTPIAKGERENPLSREELLSKFYTMTEGTAFVSRREQIAEMALELDRCPGISDLMDLLSAS